MRGSSSLRPPWPLQINRSSFQAKNLLALLPLAGGPLEALEAPLTPAISLVDVPVPIAGPIIGDAYHFDGTNDGMTVALDFSAESKMIVSFWLYWDLYATDDKLAMEFSANYNSSSGGFIIDPNDFNGFWVFGANSSAAKGWRFARPSAKIWHQFTLYMDLSVNPNVRAAFVDGHEVVTTKWTGDDTDTGTFGSHTLYIMSRASASLFGAGRLADLRFYRGSTISYAQALAQQMFNQNTRWDLYATESPVSTPLALGVAAGGAGGGSAHAQMGCQGLVTDNMANASCNGLFAQ